MEMAGKIDGKMAEPGGGDECRDVLQILGRKEVLEALSEGFCSHCQALLESRINNLIINRDFDGSILAEKVSRISLSNDNTESSVGFWSAEVSSSTCSSEKSSNSLSNGSYRQESGTPWSSTRTPEPVYSARRKGYAANSSPSTVNSDKHSFGNSGSKMSLNNGVNGVSSVVGNGLSEEQNEHIRIPQVGRKKDFVHIERIHGKATNVLQGLELHTGVFNAEEQKNIVECVYNLQRMGQKGQLRERTYSEPRKWMRGKGRVTIQFGCCYNYAVDRNGNPPGIVRDEEIDPLPPLFKQMIKRMVRWHVLPPTCVPDSCIVNIYDEGDCIPPHIDHHDFLRPFCTVSFLTECNIVFGSILKIVNAGEFSGPVSIPLPVGSVLILNGNGADIAKHCVPAVPAKRISITFRKMDDSKLPYKFLPDPDLQGIKPLVYASSTLSPVQQNQHHNRKLARDESKIVGETRSNSFFMGKDDFPPLGGSNSVNRQRVNRYGPKK